MTTLTDGCLCGAMRYSVSTSISELRACHCHDCQRVAHIWTRSARSWSHLEPGTQQFPGQPDAPPK